MPHPGVEAGTVLAGRYRVEDLSADAAGARRWRAVDEVLARSVSVEVLASEDPRAPALLEAARRSSVVSDGRFVHVLDAFDESGTVVVVREWIPGQPLDAMLAEGPLSHRRAAWIVRECAAALAAAHDLGIAHLCLVPANVALTASGGVKIAGLATDAAVEELTSDDPSGNDVLGLGRLLYACLVARWPGGPMSGLPAAPTENGRLLRPRQVRAGVPRPLDALCAAILSPPQAGSTSAPRSAREVSTALATALDALAEPKDAPAPVEQPAPALLGGAAGSNFPAQPDPGAAAERTAAFFAPRGPAEQPAAGASAATTLDTPVRPAPPPRPGGSALAGTRRPWRRWLLWLAVASLVLGGGLLAYQVGRSGATPDRAPPGPTGSPATGGPSPGQLSVIPIAGVADFDPVVDGGSGAENPDLAPLAIDHNPATAWTTVTYFDNPPLGGKKPGVGLVVDLGSPTSVREVSVRLVGTGTDLQLGAAPRTAPSVPASVTGFSPVARHRDAGARVVFRLDRPVTTRFLLVYLTSLPLESPGNYRGGIAEIAVRG